MSEQYVVEERPLRSSHKGSEELDYVAGDAKRFHVIDTFRDVSLVSFGTEAEAIEECTRLNAEQ